MDKNTALLDWIHNELFGTPTGIDIAQHAPDLSSADAYRIRLELVKRRIAAGDALIGYKVGGSSKAIREEEDVQEQLVGALMRSGLVPSFGTMAFGAAKKMAVEAEVAVMMKRELRGPGVGLLDVHAAVEGYFPAIEIIPGSGIKRSEQARILGAKFTGGIVLGPKLSSPHGLDLRLEGAVLSVNGVPKGSATGVAVLGNPLNAVALVANHLAAYGQSLMPGMIVMTGSYMGNVHVAPGDYMQVEFTRLGSASVRFTP
jgi:2-keto-4-pentenoate hydratase